MGNVYIVTVDNGKHVKMIDIRDIQRGIYNDLKNIEIKEYSLPAGTRFQAPVKFYYNSEVKRLFLYGTDICSIILT